jgi:cytochrome c oxidase assembly protein subunit 15
MRADAGRLRTVRSLALLVCALSLVVVAVSAYLRLAAAGLGCTDWPSCYGALLTGAPPSLHYGFSRLLHRFAASAALILTCVMVWRCLRPQPLLPAARYAFLLLLLMLALSVLGFFSADPRRALVGFLNIVGGLGLVTFSWRVAMSARPSSFAAIEHRPPQGLLLRAGVIFLTLVVLLGAWIGATYSAVACPSVPDCGGVWWPAADSWAVLNPLQRLASAPMPGDSGGVGLHLLHRVLALMAVLTLGVSAVISLKHPAMRTAAAAVLLLLGVVLGLGFASVASGLSLWLVVGHGAAAALLLAAVVSYMRR